MWRDIGDEKAKYAIKEDSNESLGVSKDVGYRDVTASNKGY